MLFKMVLSKRGSLRHSRMTYDEDQIEELEKEYAKSPYLNNANRKKLSQKMHIDERRLKVWFQNRRMREKTKTQINNKDVISERNSERKLRSVKKANPVAEPVSVKSASPVLESLLTKSSSPPRHSYQSPKWIPQVPYIYGKSCFDAPRSKFPHCISSCGMISRRYLSPYAVRKPMHQRNSTMPECVKHVHPSKDFGDAASCQTSTYAAHSSMNNLTIPSFNTIFNYGVRNDWESSHLFRKVAGPIDGSVTKENNHACCVNCNKIPVTSSSPDTEQLCENSRNRSFHLLPKPNASCSISTDQNSTENTNDIYRNKYEDLNADSKHCILNSESNLCYDKMYSSKLHSPNYSIENILRPPLQTLECMVEDVDNYQRKFPTSKCCRSSHLSDTSHQSSNQWHSQTLSDTNHKQSIQFDMPYSQSLSSTKLQPATQWSISSSESIAKSTHHQSYQWQTPSPQSTSVTGYQPLIESHNLSFKLASSQSTSASIHQPSVEWHGPSSKSLSSQPLFDTNLQQSNEFHIPSSQTSLVDSYQLPDERSNCSSISLNANPIPSFQWHRQSTHLSSPTSHLSAFKRQSSSQLSTPVDNQQRLSQCHNSPPQSSPDNGHESPSQWHSLLPQSSLTCHEPSSQWYNLSSQSSAISRPESSNQWHGLSPQSSSINSHEKPSQSHDLSPQSSSVFSNEPSSEWQGLSPQSSSVTNHEPSSQWHSLSPQSASVSSHEQPNLWHSLSSQSSSVTSSEPSSEWQALSPQSSLVSSNEIPSQSHHLSPESTLVFSHEPSSEWQGLSPQSSSVTSHEPSSQWHSLSPQSSSGSGHEQLNLWHGLSSQSSSATSLEPSSQWHSLSPQLLSPNSQQSPSCSYSSSCQPVFQNSTSLDIQSAYQTPEMKSACSYQFDTQEISQNDCSTYWSLRQL